jgi:hypothetical protein
MESELHKVLLLLVECVKGLKAFQVANDANKLFIVTNYHNMLQLKINMAGSCMSAAPTSICRHSEPLL